ncbi:MAG: ATP-binding cassette domain-containing protein [Candidatus Bipolaricaulia bacterium]
MQDISKAFGAVQALQDVSLRLYHDEILGLVGDNAAGKSTLMKILSGAYFPDTGEIYFEGERVHVHSPKDARGLGIEMVYQDLALCGNLDVATNIFLGRWPTKRWPGNIFRFLERWRTKRQRSKRWLIKTKNYLERWPNIVDAKRMNASADGILDKLQVGVHSVKLRVETLSGGRQQSVAIARSISFEPKVLIMDEPTANLSATATKRVLQQIQELKQHGVSVIVISHRLEDIFTVGDRVMVLRHGLNAGERVIRETTEDEVLGLIISGESSQEVRTGT